MRKMDHLVCFMPGALALGAHTDPKGKDSPRAKRDMAVAKVRPFCCYSSCFLFCFSSCYSFRCASCYSFLVTLRVSHVVYPLYPSISLLPTSQQFFQISAKTNHPYLTHPYHLSYLNSLCPTHHTTPISGVNVHLLPNVRPNEVRNLGGICGISSVGCSRFCHYFGPFLYFTSGNRRIIVYFGTIDR